MKIYLYAPGSIKRASDVLQNGSVMQRVFQPHEAHVPYILQVFMDYNLHGMNLIHVRSCCFRTPLGKPVGPVVLQRINPPTEVATKEEKSEQAGLLSTSQVQNFNWNAYKDARDASASSGHEDSVASPSAPNKICCSQTCSDVLSRTIGDHSFSGSNDTNVPNASACPLHVMWTKDTIPNLALLRPDVVERQSICDLEIDVIGAEILNRNELSTASGRNPGIASIWADEKLRRKNQMGSSQIVLNKSQDPRSNLDVNDREAKCIYDLNIAVDKYYTENADRTQLDCSHEVRNPSSQPPHDEEMKSEDSISDEELFKMLAAMDSVRPKEKQPLIASQHSATYNDSSDDETTNGQREREKKLTNESYVMTQPWESGI
uniref:DNA-directed DNA polymerase family B exonuclease domain-containing protein n=1 Tax=Ciona savignyi TaxID=51511 RepID=H2ZKE2_CIOSA